MNILFVTNVPPFPHWPDGGGQRTALLIEAMLALGDVTIALVTRPGSPPPECLDSLCRQYPGLKSFHWDVGEQARRDSRLASNVMSSYLYYFKRDRGIYHERSHLVGEFERIVDDKKINLIVGRYLRPTLTSGILSVAKKGGRRIPILIDIDDFDPCVSASRNSHLPLHRRLAFAFQNWVLERHLSSRIAGVKQLFVSNPDDLVRLRKRGHRVVLLPNIPFLSKRDTAPLKDEAGRKASNLLFIGNLSHRPNVDGLDWFLEKCWNAIIANEPCTRLEIVGSKLRETDRLRWSRYQNVIVTGFVENLEGAYANCSFTICPVLWGGGSNIKVLESLFYRRTSVVSSRAAQSHSDILADGIDYLVAKSEKDFVACCLRLIRDPSLADGLAEHGESQVTRMRSKDIFRSIVHGAIKEIP